MIELKDIIDRKLEVPIVTYWGDIVNTNINNWCVWGKAKSSGVVIYLKIFIQSRETIIYDDKGIIYHLFYYTGQTNWGKQISWELLEYCKKHKLPYYD